jgi:hypothetical protein
VRTQWGRLAACSVLAGLSFVGVGQLAWSTAWVDLGAPPFRIDDRYRDVVSSLPEDAVIGYVSDLPRDLGDGDYRFYERYYQAQHACAPRLLIDSPAHDLVLADLSDPGSVLAIAARHGLLVARSSPSGHVVLMVRTSDGAEP